MLLSNSSSLPKLPQIPIPTQCTVDSKVLKDVDSNTEDLYLTLVYRTDGIVNLEYIHLLAQSPEVADTFKKSVNALTVNMLHAHASPESFLKKQ